MINKIVYAKANKIDANVVIKLSLLLNEDDNTKTLKNIKEAIGAALENNLVWVAKNKGNVVGYALCELFGGKKINFPNSIFISELYVMEAFRKQGVGKELIKFVMSNKFPKKYAYFSITHDPEVKFLTGFYKSLGFEKVGVTAVGNVKLIRKI